MMSGATFRGWVMMGLLALAFAVPAAAAGSSSSTASCSQASAHPFLPWLDPAAYTLTPGGTFESGSPGWSRSGGAAVVKGNETYYVHASTDSRSLWLPPGSSATTPSMCVTLMYPTLRLFVRNTGSALSTLKVEVLFTNTLGQAQALTVALLASGSSWAPTLPMLFLANATAPLATSGNVAVAFRFTPLGSGGSWQVDDAYVDPYQSR
jgi:hypothetical protein